MPPDLTSCNASCNASYNASCNASCNARRGAMEPKAAVCVSINRRTIIATYQASYVIHSCCDRQLLNISCTMEAQIAPWFNCVVACAEKTINNNSPACIISLLSRISKTKANARLVPEDMKSCYCGHVFKQPKSINGKRFTEGRFYFEAEDEAFEPKKKHKCPTSVFYKERITYMPGFSYEEQEGDYGEVHEEKKEKKRRRRKPMNLINGTMKYQNNNMQHHLSNNDNKQHEQQQRVNLMPKDINLIVDAEPLFDVLQEINNKITNQRRLWINLDA
eukprot:gene17555-19306_t